MAIFILDCEPVTATSTSISSVGSQVNQLSSSVSGYDTSCEDDFDFSSAARAISANIDACSTKIDNTSSLITNVVDSHTSLQSTLLYGDDTSSSSNDTDTSSNSTDTSSSSNYSSSGYSSSGYSSNTNTVASTATIVSGTTKNTDTSTDMKKDTKKDTKAETTTEVDSAESEEEDNSTVDITKNVEKINYYSIDSENSISYDFNDSGYAVYGDKYIITCNENLGNIGDTITITKDDGTSIECIIGGTTTGVDSQVNFVVDSSNFDPNNSLIENIDNTVKIVNEGGGLENFEDGIINVIEQGPNYVSNTVSSTSVVSEIESEINALQESITSEENLSTGVDI